MTRVEGKIQLFVQRYDGGLGWRHVLIAPALVALYDKIWSRERAWGYFVDRQFMHKDDPLCTGSFSILPDDTTRIEVWTVESPFSEADALYVVGRAFRDNRDGARLCRNPAILLNGTLRGRARDLC